MPFELISISARITSTRDRPRLTRMPVRIIGSDAGSTVLRSVAVRE
jgi:hypothetical protein